MGKENIENEVLGGLIPCKEYGCNVVAVVMQQYKWGIKCAGNQDLGGMPERGTFCGGRWSMDEFMEEVVLVDRR